MQSGWIGIRCLWCTDSSNHLGISPEKGISCFRCGEKGTVIKLVMKLERCNLKHAITIIKEFSRQIPLTLQNAPRETPLIELRKPITHDFLTDLYKNYLKKRRFEPRRNYPRGSACAAPQAKVKGRRGGRLDLKVSFLEGRRHLPVAEGAVGADRNAVAALDASRLELARNFRKTFSPQHNNSGRTYLGAYAVPFAF